MIILKIDLHVILKYLIEKKKLIFNPCMLSSKKQHNWLISKNLMIQVREK